VISVVGTLLGKSLKLLLSDVIFKAKMHHTDFGGGFAPDPSGGAYSASQIPWLDLRESASEVKEGRGREGRREGKEMGKWRVRKGVKRGEVEGSI